MSNEQEGFDDGYGEHLEAVGEFVDASTRCCDGLSLATMRELPDGWSMMALEFIRNVADDFDSDHASQARRLLPLVERFAGVSINDGPEVFGRAA